MKSENMLEAVETDRSFIPAYCETVYEQSLYLAEGAESIFNEMFKNIGIEELAVYESTGMTVVYEGAKLEELKKTLLAALDKLWGAIKHSFEQMMAKMKQKVLDGKFKSVNRESIKNLPTDLKLPSIHEYPGLDHSKKPEFAANAGKVFVELRDNTPDKNGEDQKALDQFKVDMDGLKIYAEVSGITDAKSAADIKAKLKEQIIGAAKEITVADLMKDSTLVNMQLAVQQNEILKMIKEGYNAEKKNIDSLKSMVKGIKSDFSEQFKVLSSAVKDLVIALNTCHSIYLDCAFMQMREYGAVLAACAASLAKANKGAKKDEKPADEVQHNSAMLEAVTSQKDLVDSYFAW